MSQAFIQMSAIFAELELSIIRARVKSGMANAKAKGSKIGRKPTTKDDIPTVFYKHYPAFMSGSMNLSEFARICGLSRPAIYQYLKTVGLEMPLALGLERGARPCIYARICASFAANSSLRLVFCNPPWRISSTATPRPPLPRWKASAAALASCWRSFLPKESSWSCPKSKKKCLRRDQPSPNRRRKLL